MEVLAHLERRCHPDIIGQDRVQRPPERDGTPARGNPHTSRLPSSVNSTVGPARTHYRGVAAAQVPDRILHDTLHGAKVGLSLPSAEARAVIVKDQQHVARLHVLGTYSDI
jgi:hypothetical protein